MKEDPRSSLPAVDALARKLEKRVRPAAPWALALAARQAISEARAGIQAGEAPGTQQALEARAERCARALLRARPARVVNATGVVLHTGLGRSVLAPGAARAAAQAGGHYADLEIEPASGKRGDRLAGVQALLCALSGAEAALVVNNNAAALLLALNTLARGREVIVSRGELVEIGGSFRVPEILERAGVRLREVGATNRTHLRDYEAAVGEGTALLLKVHRSNFEQRGFVSEVELDELVALGRRTGLPVVEDLGSGSLVELPTLGAAAKASHAPSRLATGVDLLCFSGDKLLGGPQAGVLLGAQSMIAALAENPLARALRLDKMSLAALDYTLRALIEGRRAELPTLNALEAPLEEVRARALELARRLSQALAGTLQVEVARVRAQVGGGSLPGLELGSYAALLTPPPGQSAAGLAARLRAAETPVIARVREGRVLLDVRTLQPGDPECIEAALCAALRED